MSAPVIAPGRSEHDAPDFLRVTRGGWKDFEAMRGGAAAVAPRKTPKGDREALKARAVELYQSGGTILESCADTGLSFWSVREAIRAAGLPVRKKGGTYGKR